MENCNKYGTNKAGSQDIKGMARENGMEQTLKDLSGSRHADDVRLHEGGSTMENVIRDVYSGN